MGRAARTARGAEEDEIAGLRRASQADAATAAFPHGTPDFVTTSALETMGPAAAMTGPSGDVEALTANSPRSFRTWVNDDAKAFA